MSLRIWLPLTKDLRNQGLDDVTITNNGATFNSAGKLGGCYKTSNSGDMDLKYSGAQINTGSLSLCGWFKFNKAELAATWGSYSFDSTRPNPTGNLIGNNSYGGVGLIWSTNSLVSGAAFTSLYVACSIRSTTNGARITSNIIIPFDTWVHLALVFNKDTKALELWLNGELKVTNAMLDFNDAKTDNLKLNYRATWGGNNPSYNIPFLVNDVRIYDHCLSPLEVKQISQGLILHYPLNRGGLGPTNLLKNGFGELGIENWSYAAGMFSDVPENHPEIYHSYKNVESKEFIPIYRNHNYKFSTWIKTAASSGNSYPSICPYDADKHFIATNNCKEGFDLKTMTILTRELKAGDTKIYVEDLSKWNTNSGHYYDTAAIFGYKDGTGYVWPDGTYTRNCPAFSSGTEAKTNLDKTNNIITLLTAYNGVTIPVGTKICASTYGNTYFYPCGGIPYSTITNWIFKENTFSSETPRLSAAKYIRVLAYSNCYQAGMTVTDLTMESFNNNIEYDCSGFGNNGTRTGTFSWTNNTPKYNVSTVFNGTDNAIQTPSLPSMISDKNYTIAVWIYKTVIGSKGYQTIYGGPSGFEIEARNGGANETKFVPWNWGKPMASYELNEWNHCVFVHSDSDCKIYLNGEYIATGTAKASNPSGNYFVGAWNTATQQNFDGLMSDFRIYATALSAENVKSLYNNSAYIDNQGNIYGAVYEEV